MIFSFVSILIFLVFNSVFSLDFPEQKKEVSVEIIPENGIFMDADSYYFGIKFNLKNGWKTYWKNPGDAGDSLSIDWVNKSDSNELELLFPFPKKFIDNQVTTIGYENEVIFPVKVKKDFLEKIDNEVELNYLICKDVCLPINEIKPVKLNFDNIVSSSEFNNYFHRVPQSNVNFFNLSLSKVFNDSIEVQIIEDIEEVNIQHSIFAFSKEANLTIDRNFINSDIFTINFDEKIKNIKHPILISVSNGEKFEEIQLIITNKNNNNIFYFFLLALIGGVILNFMPCVLPVVSLKLYSFTGLSKQNYNEIRKNCSMIIFGILASFMLLALFVVTLKYFGNNVGWGFQFQNIYFLIFITILLFMFSLNLLGFFELLLPMKLNNSINELMNKNGYIGNFLTGFFATLLATPCSAPFLGTAVGFSMLASGYKIFLIFLAISIGFSVPYICLILFPKFISVLPKPGKWMINFKSLLGLLMLLTAIWFLYLMKINSYIIFIVFFAILFSSYIIEKTMFKGLIIVSTIVVSIFFIPNLFFNENKNVQWIKFEDDLLQKYILEKEIVLVDVTADWCVTCQVNKLTTLQNKDIEEFIFKHKIKTLRADWTNKDNDILNFIKRYNRFGIPVNLIYGPKNKDGILLPEILSKDMLIKKFNEVGLHEDKRK